VQNFSVELPTRKFSHVQWATSIYVKISENSTFFLKNRIPSKVYEFTSLQNLFERLIYTKQISNGEAFLTLPLTTLWLLLCTIRKVVANKNTEVNIYWGVK